MKQFRFLMIAAMIIAALGFQAGQVNAYAYSYTSGIQVQNLANAAASVTLNYITAQHADGTGADSAATASVDMPALGSSTFFPIHAPTGFNGSVVISSSQPMASIANLVGSSGGTHIGDAAYVGVASGGKSIYLPLLHKGNYGFNSWFSVQNTGSADAKVDVSYSDKTAPAQVTIKPGASYTFDQANEPHNLKFFAGTVTSDQPVAVVVIQENTNGKTIQAYTGFDKAETDALMPLINANNYGFYTGIQVQNSGTQDADITLAYAPTVENGAAIGHSCTETHRIAAGASVTYALFAFGSAGPFTPSTTDITTCVKERFVGSAKITANKGVTDQTAQPVITVVNQATPKSAGAYGSFPPSRSTAKVVLPLIMDRNYGWYTGFNLMNVGDVSVDVTCSFTAPSTYTFTKTLAVGEALNDIQNNKIGNHYAGSGACTAVVSGGGTGTPLITAVVNQISPNANDNLLVYEGVNVAP